jgi:hypothetical protein
VLTGAGIILPGLAYSRGLLVQCSCYKRRGRGILWTLISTLEVDVLAVSVDVTAGCNDDLVTTTDKRVNLSLFTLLHSYIG